MALLKRLSLVILVVMLCSCGYKMVGKETHLPPGISSIAIPTFKSKTLEPGIEIPFTQAFLNEFIRDRRIKVVGREEADAVLEGVIRSYDYYSIAYDKTGLATEYRATVTVDLVLKRRNGEIVWKENNLTETRSFRLSNVAIVTESNKNVALEQIGALMAGRIRNRFFYNF